MAQPLSLPPGSDVRLADFDADYHAGLDKDAGKSETRRLWEELDDLAYRLYAEARRAVLVVLQGIDTAGKDGTIRMLARGISPQCLDVVSFKAPSPLELAHDFLWRVHKAMPAHGRIGIFNRSHYEDVIVVRVRKLVAKPVWQARYDQINAFEKLLTDGGLTIVKCFLHISKDEQRERLEERLRDPHKQWKLGPADLDDRRLPQRHAYESLLPPRDDLSAPDRELEGRSGGLRARGRRLQHASLRTGRSVQHKRVFITEREMDAAEGSHLG